MHKYAHKHTPSSPVDKAKDGDVVVVTGHAKSTENLIERGVATSIAHILLAKDCTYKKFFAGMWRITLSSPQTMTSSLLRAFSYSILFSASSKPRRNFSINSCFSLFDIQTCYSQNI